MTGFTVYFMVVVVVVAVLHFSADTAVWWQQGKAVTCEGQGSGALGRLEWLPVPFNPFLSRIFGQALHLFFFFFLFFV